MQQKTIDIFCCRLIIIVGKTRKGDNHESIFQDHQNNRCASHIIGMCNNHFTIHPRIEFGRVAKLRHTGYLDGRIEGDSI